MKVIRSNTIPIQPASHEDPSDPGVVKKVLLGPSEVPVGKLQMINWATMKSNRKFAAHYHEDMEEIFIILRGKARLRVESEITELNAGDTVRIPPMAKHEMWNSSTEIVEYIVVGISQSKGGKTVVTAK